MPPQDPEEPQIQVDLHGLRPEEALRRLGQTLHAARVRRASRVLVITGRGMGNHVQAPVLRTRVEAWLKGPEGQRLGVRGFERTARGGALLVRLG